MKRLAAFLLETSQENLEFGIGQQGPQISAKDSGKIRELLAVGKVVNVNSAVLPAELYELTLNCRYIWRAPFQVPDKEKEVRPVLTLTYAFAAPHCRRGD